MLNVYLNLLLMSTVERTELNLQFIIREFRFLLLEFGSQWKLLSFLDF